MAIPTYEELLNRLDSKIKTQTNIAASVNSSAYGMLLKAIASEMYSLYEEVELYRQQSNLFTAFGQGLDNWGSLLGVPRKQAVSASTLGINRSVQFSNSGVSSTTIPAGTRVWSGNDINLAYFTDEGITLGAGENGFVHVTAARVGENYNIDAYTLNRHSHTAALVTVANVLPISNGSLRESDQSYRERLVQSFRSRNVINSQTVDAAIRQIPSIQNVIIVPQYQGPGSFEAIITPYNPADLATAIESANTVLGDLLPPGWVYNVRSVTYRHLDINVKLVYDESYTSSKSDIREVIKQQIVSYVGSFSGNTEIGTSDLSLSRIKGIAATSPGVKDALVDIKVDGMLVASTGVLSFDIAELPNVRQISVV